jgi:predicted nucleic acid-binding protein
LIDSAEWIGVPWVVVGELWSGFIVGANFERNAQELREFLASPPVEPLTLDFDVAKAYGEILAALRKHGTPLPINDIWVAASAARFGATVLTFDRHFEAISRVGSVVL